MSSVLDRYALFLDDEREPPADGRLWVVARTVAKAIETVHLLGFPSFVSFDNDLGMNEPEGHTFATWLIDHDLDTQTMPDDFEFYAHTQNPVRRDYITGTLKMYLTIRKT